MAIDNRIVLTEEVGNLMVPRSQIMTFKSMGQAIVAAEEACPEIPWRRIFPALEAAGLVKFGVD